MLRKIIHIDMDAFYASVEQRDFPELKGKCIAVGGTSERGVVATASYEAREYGVKSAMPSVIAKRKCPKLIFVKPRFEVYKEVSYQIREIFREYTDLIEPLSLDEAYMDVTENKMNIAVATTIALEIKDKIKTRTGLTASAGVSYNKFLAKIASDYQKPDGIFVVTPKMAEHFVEELPISKFHGIGKVTADRMANMGIHTGLDLKKLTKEKLIREFGKAGNHYYNISRGIDERPVNPSRIRKSIGSENTFSVDLLSLHEMQHGIKPQMEEVWEWCEKNLVFGRTVTVKMKFQDFTIISRSKSSLYPITNQELYQKIVLELLEECFSPPSKVRLLGVSISNLTDYKIGIGRQLEINFNTKIQL